MSLSDERAEDLAKAARAAATNARAAVKLLDAAREELTDLRTRVAALERSAVHRLVDLLHGSPALQRSAAAALIVVVLVVAYLLAPGLFPFLPLLGGIHAPTTP